MAKLSVALLSTSLVGLLSGCSFSVGTSRPAPPPPQARPAAPPPQSATPAPAVRTIGRRNPNQPYRPGTAPKPVTPATPVAPVAGVPTMSGTNIFGSGTVDATGWKGNLYAINPGTTKLPQLAGVTPNGIFFTHQLNTANQTMTGGFPGIDATRNENFAIRFEAPLVVDTESDYTFRIVSDDGAILDIDDTLIIDNDGVHTSAEKSGPVHLVVGTHTITVDYFQSTGPVALQLFCKKGSGTESVCPTHLQ